MLLHCCFSLDEASRRIELSVLSASHRVTWLDWQDISNKSIVFIPVFYFWTTWFSLFALYLEYASMVFNLSASSLLSGISSHLPSWLSSSITGDFMCRFNISLFHMLFSSSSLFIPPSPELMCDSRFLVFMLWQYHGDVKWVVHTPSLFCPGLPR